MAGLQQQGLQAEPVLGGRVGLVQPAGQQHGAEVRGGGVGQLLQDGLLQPQLLTERVQQGATRSLCTTEEDKRRQEVTRSLKAGASGL